MSAENGPAPLAQFARHADGGWVCRSCGEPAALDDAGELCCAEPTCTGVIPPTFDHGGDNAWGYLPTNERELDPRNGECNGSHV